MIPVASSLAVIGRQLDVSGPNWHDLSDFTKTICYTAPAEESVNYSRVQYWFMTVQILSQSQPKSGWLGVRLMEETRDFHSDSTPTIPSLLYFTPLFFYLASYSMLLGGLLL